MGRYINQSNVEDVYGIDNVATWSNLEGGTAANVSRIASAIAYAEALIDDSFRDSRYAVPFTTVPVILQDWCAKLTGVWLFTCRPLYSKKPEDTEGFLAIKEAVEDEIRTYNAGQRVMDAVKSSTIDVTAPIIV